MNSDLSQELLDVVDENDRVIGARTRGEIHARGLMHRATHILVFNSQGELFLQKRSMSKDENPGLWDTSAAGHVNSGEDYLTCAVRELDEELGISGDVSLKLLFRLPVSSLTGMEHSTVYACQYDGPLKLQAEEIDEGLWVSPQAMSQRVKDSDPSLTDGAKLIWKWYCSRYGPFPWGDIQPGSPRYQD